MGGACSLNSLYPVQSNAFNKHPQYHHTDTCTQQSFGRIHSNTFDAEHDAMKVNRIETLPDVILIEIFRWLHPIDRIHSISLISKHLQKLCLYVVKDENGNPTSNDIEDILPKILPKLVLLDIGYFPEMSSSLLNKLDSCMPNLQKLNMEHAFSVSSYEVIFCKRRFVNIRELILCGWGLTAHKIETLFHLKKQLEVLNADEASNTTGMHS
ncbi:unnamed protein product, partial [Anisakis simplex]|uniref:F-box domain-containing protein n=1 Tax=Anisakis simplex TaxID=6269 RepID=A0A0M3KAE0_ANISI